MATDKGFKVVCLNCGSDEVTKIADSGEYESTITFSCMVCDNEIQEWC